MVVARVSRRRSPWLAISGAAILLLAAVALLLLNVLGGPAYERLAVLPPTNLMNDPEQEYFVQGVHTALISELQRAGILVIARTSVLQYENTQKPIRDIAAELGVDALIESSVFRAGDSVEMQVHLVDGRTQQYVAEPITRGGQLRDVMLLYRNLSSAIAAEIHAALTPEAEAHLASARPVNPQAYEAYLRGVSQWHATRIDLALEYFQQALSLDSTYAPAQAGIALVWWFGGARAQAGAAAQQALALDSTLAEVQHAVALIQVWLEWDWEAGEAAFRKAIEINPNYADTRAFYAAFLYIMERQEEGRAHMERALELDPLNLFFRAMNGLMLCWELRYAEGVEELEAVLRIEPDHTVAIANLVDPYHLNGNYDEALAMVRRMHPGDQGLQEALYRGYAEGGYRAAWLRYAETLAARTEAAVPVEVALAYAWAGDKERTLEWLELAYQAHDIILPANLPAAGLGPVPGDDPRYQALRRRMKLPQ
jgi:TolB-like protein